MGNCKTCKYWESFNKEEHYKQDLGECMKAVLFWNAYDWNKETGYPEIIEECKDDKMFVQDGSDYVAALYTRSDFGCVSFEWKNGG